MSRLVRIAVLLIALISVSGPAIAAPRQVTLRLENLSLETRAKALRKLKDSVYRLGVRRAHVDLMKGELYVVPRGNLSRARLERAAARAGFDTVSTNL